MFSKPLLVLALSSVAMSAMAADKLEQSKSLVSQTNQSLAASQKTIDKVDEKSERMFDQYKSVQAEIENLEVYNRQLSDIVTSQEDEKDVLNKSINGIEKTAQGIMPFMEKMIGALETFIASDYPFLPQEREARIQRLRDSMKRADISVAAKYRQILESYQIELDYGNTIEAYDGEVDGKKVTFFKLGRVGLYQLSFDKTSVKAWNIEKGQWQVLDDMDYKISIVNAIKIAKKQKSPDLFFAAIQSAGVK